MSTSVLFVVALLAVSCVGVTAMLWARRKAHPSTPSRAGDVAVVDVLADAPSPVEEPLPAFIAVGEDPNRPAVLIAPLADVERFRTGKKLELGSSLAGRANALMQAVPSLLVANAHRGKQLMEVVIKGDLVRSSAGEGYRAFALGSNGKIAEHATLLDVGKLSNAVNAAAVFQLASVVVAQKHLADISAKLDAIAKSVSEIGTFLDSGRRARLIGAYGYLQQVAQAIQGGELSLAIRAQLEDCERDLMEVQHHLSQEYRSKVAETVEHSDTAGTEELTKNAMKKFTKLDSLSKDIGLSIKARALAWYVLSLYPGEPLLKNTRKSDIERGIAELVELNAALDAGLRLDLNKFKSIWNFQSTLNDRKDEVRKVARAAHAQLERSRTDCAEDLYHSSQLLLRHDQPTHLFFELEDGRISNVRVAPAG